MLNKDGCYNILLILVMCMRNSKTGCLQKRSPPLIESVRGTRRVKLDYALFADESGTYSVDKCYTMGCLLIPCDNLDKFEGDIRELIEKHNLPTVRELKWSRVGRSDGIINFAIDVVKLMFTSPSSFVCKVTWKRLYRL